MERQSTLELELRAALETRLGGSRYRLWFGEGVHLELDGESLVVTVPNRFFREWIQAHFAGTLVEVAEAITNQTIQLEYRLASAAHQTERDDSEDSGSARLGESLTRVSRFTPADFVPEPKVAPGSSVVPRRPAKRLDDYVVGPGNRLAHAAALEIVQSAGSSFNPLVVFGGIGQGKSHLLEGIAVALRERYTTWNVVHTTAEAFTNAFIEAMRAGGMAAFRTRYRTADALVLDDAHFLAAKRSTQEEFLHTYNALAASGAPLIFSTDQHPRQLPKLGEDIVTRLLAGMVVKLEAPEPETRLSILRSKAAQRGVDVPEAVITYIAENMRTNVRELEGALQSVIAHATLAKRPIDLALARSALRDTVRLTAQSVALKDIERAVCSLYSIEPEALKSDSRARHLAHPRMLAMYLARKHAGVSYNEIGRHFGGRNHSTVISAEKKVDSWLKQERQSGLLAGFESTAEVLAALERKLGL